jgi:tRNA(His) 5'-end guanylyltransferase
MNIGERFKHYEQTFSSSSELSPHFPIVARIDGRGFSKFLSKAEKPYDRNVRDIFDKTTSEVLKEMNCSSAFAYGQSDEVSFVFNFLKINENDEGKKEYIIRDWMNFRRDKFNSLISSFFTAHFNFFNSQNNIQGTNKKLGFFDCRTFNLPWEELNNYLIWRQQDTLRNAIQSTGRYFFDDKKMMYLKNSDVIQKLKKEVDKDFYEDIPKWTYRGTLITKQPITPVLISSENSEYLYTAYDFKEFPDRCSIELLNR